MGTIAYFSNTPYPVRASKKITNDEKMLYGEIVARLETAGYCKTSNIEFANFFGVEGRTISNWLSNLEKNKFVNVVQNHHKHRRQIYVNAYIPPMEEEQPDKFSDKQKMFAEAFPDRQIDTADIPDYVDMQLLIDNIKASPFLMRAKSCGLAWCVKKYKTIIAGGYDDLGREAGNKKSNFGTERHYTKAEANSLMYTIDKIDDIEI